MENKSLVTLINETAKLEQMLIESGGEITEEIEKALAIKETNLPEKIDGYKFTIDKFSSHESFYAERAEFYSRTAKACANVQERLKNGIKEAMQALGVSELVGSDIRFTLQKSAPSVIVEDESLIPEEFKSTKVTISIDKKKLKDALSLSDLPGASLKEGVTLKVYANNNK